MKNLLLAMALGTAFAVTAVSAASSDSTDIHYSRPTKYTSLMRSPDWWNSQELTDDWGGPRNTLYDEGVSINASYLSNIAGNPVGGESAGFTYCDNIGFELALDLEKLIGWKGGDFTVSGLNRDGSSLSEKNIGNQFTVQQVFGGSAVMFYALHLEQKFWDEKVSIKIGRFATGDEFASSQIYWLYMNNGIDGNPQALPVNTQFSAYPWAVWAARVRVKPTPEFNALLGVYQVSDRIFNRNYHGLDWSMRSNDSILLISQIGWTPEFFKRPVPAENKATSGGKTTVGGKSIVVAGSAKQLITDSELKGLPGHYWFGAYWSPWNFPQFGSTETATNSYGFYWHADQMIFQEAPGSDQGLTIWSAFVLSPQQNIAKWNYKIQMTKFAFVQPDLQWVINPGGTNRIPNALVLGAQMGVNSKSPADTSIIGNRLMVDGGWTAQLSDNA